MKEKFLKSIVLLMTGVIVFCSATMMFSAAEVTPTPPTTVTTTEAPTEASTEATTEATTGATTGADTQSTTEATTEDTGYTTTTWDDRNFTSATTTTKANTTKKTNTTKRTNTPGKKPASSVLETTTTDESTTEYTDSVYGDQTTAYVWTFADETTEAENENNGVNVKKIVIIAVIVVAVIGAGVCLFILGKKK